VACAAAFATLALCAAQLGVTDSSLEWGVVSVLLAVTGSLCAVSATHHARRSGLFLPVSFIGLWAVAFGLASLAWRHPEDNVRTLSRGLRLESLPLGLAVASVALLAWTVGYCFVRLRLPRAAVSSLRRWSTGSAERLASVSYSLKRIALVYFVGVAARLALLALGRYSYITTDLQAAITQSNPIAAAFNQLEFLTTVALLLLAYTRFKTDGRLSGWLLGTALTIEFAFGLISGMRSFILFRLIGVAVTYFLIRRRLPVFACLAVAGILTLLSPFTEAYRDGVRTENRTTVTASDAVELVPLLLTSTFRELPLSDFALGPFRFVTQRLRFVDEVAIVGQRTPSEIPYIPPSETFLDGATVLVPRVIWSGKPVYTVGIQYARDFWKQPLSLVSARSPTYPGEAYYRGGWAGVILLMALLGALMAAVNSALSPTLYSAAIPMFVVAWTQLVSLEGSLILLPAGLVQSLLLTALAMRWTRQRI
jgi:hypothetical protein